MAPPPQAVSGGCGFLLPGAETGRSSLEERLAVCESHFDFRADIVVVYGR